MKHIHKFTAITLCAALLLSGCSTGEPGETSQEVTSAQIEEASVTESPETVPDMTSASAVTSAAGEDRIAEARAMMQKHIDDDGYIWFEMSIPTSAEKIGVLEKHFYGVWECENADPLVFTYSGEYTVPDEGEEQYTYYTDGGTFAELDDRYICPRINGGAGECCVIYKNAPDILYHTAALWVNDYENGKIIGIHSGDRSGVYKRIQTPEPTLEAGRISFLGMMKLEAIYGEDLTEELEEYLKETHTDEYGMQWVYGLDQRLPAEKRYLISRDEKSVQLGIRFFDRKAYVEFLNSSSAGIPDAAYFIVDMYCDGDHWRINDLYRQLRPYIPPDDVGIKVKAPEETITLTVTPLIDIEATAADYDFDMIPDYKNDEFWKKQKEYIEEKYKEPLEAEKYFGETLNDWKKRDYFSKPRCDCDYVGTDECDFVIRKLLGFTEVVQLDTYEIFLFVKDGKVVRATPFFKRSGLNMYIYGNDLYDTAGGGDILHIDIRTGEYDLISAPGWCSIPGINDDWMIFGNGRIDAYNRHTGEIVTPEPEISWCGLDTFYIGLKGSRIEYTAHGHPNGGWYYDLETGESGEMPEIYSGMDRSVYESSLYTAKSYYNRKNGKSSDFSKLSITRKSDGLEKVFDFTGLIDPDMEEQTGNVPYDLWWGDWFITYIKGIGRIAVNFETEETASVVIDKSGIYDISLWWQYQYGDRYMVPCWREENGSTLFGEIGFEIK